MNEVVSLKQHAELCLNVAIRLALIFWVDAASGYLGKLLCLLCCGAGRLFLSLQAAMHSAVRLREWQRDRWPKFFPFKRDDMLPWCNSVQKKSPLLVKNVLYLSELRFCLFCEWGRHPCSLKVGVMAAAAWKLQWCCQSGCSAYSAASCWGKLAWSRLKLQPKEPWLGILQSLEQD